MDLLKLLRLAVLFFIVVNYSTSSPSSIHTLSAAKDKHRRHDDQGFQSTLLNVEDKLRNIDSIHYSVKRHEIALDRILNKVDAIDSRTVRMQTIIEMKLDLLTKAVISTELKHDLLKDQLRNLESNHELLTLKLNSLEAKTEDAARKSQISQEAFFNKMENKQDQLVDKMNEILSNNFKRQLNYFEQYANKSNSGVLKQLNVRKIIFREKQLNILLKEIEEKLDKNDEMQRLTESLNGIHSHLNQSESMWTQNDGPKTTDKEKMIDNIKQELNIEAQKLGNKLSNVYNDIWTKIGQIEGQVKEGFTATNHSQKIISDDLKTLLVEQRDGETFIDISMEKVLSIAHKRFNDIQRKLDNNFQNIASAQSMFMETCHRIQEDEPKLESRVSVVLEKILDVFMNGSAKNEKQSLELLEALKAHNSQIVRIATHNTNMVVTLAEEISQDHKNLDGSIMELAERSDAITSMVQDIQDEMYELNDTIRIIPGLNRTCISSNFDSPDTEKSEEKKPGVVHALEAHYGEGVLKIVTDISQKENSSKSNPVETLSNLNKTIETNALQAIVSTSKDTAKLNGVKKLQVGEFFVKIQNSHNESTRRKEDNSDITEEVATQLMLSYIKLIREKITLKEFLSEKLTGKCYQSITDMIQHLKPINTIPREFIMELDQYENRLKFDKIYLDENKDTLIDEDHFNYDDFDLPN